MDKSRWFGCGVMVFVLAAGCAAGKDPTGEAGELERNDTADSTKTPEPSPPKDPAPPQPSAAGSPSPRDAGPAGPPVPDRDAAQPKQDDMSPADAGAPAQPKASAAADSGTAQPPPPPPPMPMPQPDPKPMVSSEISGVAFEQSMGDRKEPVPVLLYSGGYASFNTQLITKPIDIAYDVVEHPDAWPLWRRGVDRVELKTASGWNGVHYAYETRALPTGTRLSGLFNRYTENIVASVGGNAHRVRYKFSQDGTLEYCDAAEVIVVATGTIQRTNKMQKGTYTLDGYRMRVEFDDGTTADTAFFYDPERPTRFWLRNLHFEKVEGDQTLCLQP